MNTVKESLEFVAKTFPEHADRIENLADNPDFQELCEHLALVTRSATKRGSDEQRRRFADLRAKLEDELLTLLVKPTNQSEQIRRYT